MKSCLEDAEFNNCRAVLLMIDEKLKKEPNNKSLQALRVKQLEKFQNHPLYQQAVELGIEAAALRREAEESGTDELIESAELGYKILAGIVKSREFRKEAKEIRDNIINPLRDLLGCPHTPKGLRRAAEGVKGFGESFYDTGKAFTVDMPILLGKLGVRGVESLVKWEDKLGVKEGWANLGKACKGIFDQTKQDWEDLEAYKARMQAVQEVKRRHDFFCRAFDAENYHLGQDKALGYMTAEIVQALFGGEIIKGTTKGATKGIQFIKKVQQGAKVGEGVAEGVKIGKWGNLVKFRLNDKSSFKGACPDQIKEFLQQKGWKIEKLKKDKPGFKAINPTNTSDVIKIIEVDPSKLKDGTDIISVKKRYIS